MVSYYHLTTSNHRGEHNCIICTGKACYVKGSLNIMRTLAETFHVKAGRTTDDGLLSLTTAQCLGTCGLAPVVVLDGEMRGKETPDDMLRQVTEILACAKDQQETETG